jgi:PAS domain S-box-containing protein
LATTQRSFDILAPVLSREGLRGGPDARLLARALDAVEHGIVVLEAVRHSAGHLEDLEVVLANEAGARLCGLPRDVIVGSRLARDLPWSLETGLHADCVRVLEGGRAIDREQHYAIDGADLWLRLRADRLDDGIILTLDDISPLKVQAARLEESERRFRALAQVSPAGIFRTDARGRLTYANRSFAGLAGAEVDAALADGWGALLHPDDGPRMFAEWSDAAARDETYEGEVRFRRPDGTDVWVALIAAPEHAGRRTLVGFVGVAHDITERIVRERELGEARAQAEIANRAKSQFLARMSHELRTPLNAIIGFSEIIRDELFGPVGQPRYTAYANDIRQAGSHLLSLINDILDLSKVEAGKLELAPRALDPRGLAADCLRLVAGQVPGRSLSVEVADDAPALHADPRAARQILVNLLSNALKFTPPPGRVVLAFRPCPGGMVVEVADTGIGMSADEVEVALTPFGQVENAYTREVAGTGLGLPLVKSMVEAHQGRFEIESAPGKGTTVRLFFPSPA